MIEFIVEGTPVSLQGKSPGKQRWKESVSQSARERPGGGERVDFDDVGVRILHYCFDWEDNEGDLDNIAKLMLDAMSSIVFFNDNQVKELHLRRTDLAVHPVQLVAGASQLLSARLTDALSSEPGSRQGFVYVAVSTSVQHQSLS